MEFCCKDGAFFILSLLLFYDSYSCLNIYLSLLYLYSLCSSSCFLILSLSKTLILSSFYSLSLSLSIRYLSFSLASLYFSSLCFLFTSFTSIHSLCFSCTSRNFTFNCYCRSSASLTSSGILFLISFVNSSFSFLNCEILNLLFSNVCFDFVTAS